MKWTQEKLLELDKVFQEGARDTRIPVYRNPYNEDKEPDKCRAYCKGFQADFDPPNYES